MDRTLWARFGEATLKAPHAIQWLSDNGPQYTATATVLYAHELGLVPITTPGTARRATASPKPSSEHSSAIISAMSICAMLSAWANLAAVHIGVRHGVLARRRQPLVNNHPPNRRHW
jgi:hypothetical protein